MLVKDFSNEQVLDSFAGKKVFVTGHTGFKGSWLCFMLQHAGAIVKGYALSPAANQPLFSNLGFEKSIENVFADIRDGERLKREINSFRPDYIFHLAAQPLVRYSYLNPEETFSVNVMGTLNVLEAVRTLTNTCATVVVTTDKVYENNESGKAFTENDPLGGHDPYSSSKAAAEIVAQSYIRSWFMGASKQVVATARAGNVIGGGDYASDRILPDFVRALNNGNTLQVRNPHAVRPWQHVLDPLAGYLKLALILSQNGSSLSGSYNFGPEPGDVLTVKEIVELAINSWGKGKYEMPALANQPHEAHQLTLDITKAQQQLNWIPVWTAQQSVARTINWYKSFHVNKTPAHILCGEDLRMFTSAKLKSWTELR